MAENNAFKEKVDFIKLQLENADLTPYRALVFFFSVKGQKRIWKFFAKAFKYVLRVVFKLKVKSDYQLWMHKYMPKEKDFKRWTKTQASFTNRPLVSVILPVYNPDIEYLKQAVESVKNQVYDNWQLCVSDDYSSSEEVLEYLKKIQDDSRIKVVFRTENGHISKASNDALDIATGEYILFLDHDDFLTKDCLFHFVNELQSNPEIDFMYADEDKFNSAENIYEQPYFKPNWSPDTLESRNYILHPVFVKRSLIDEVEVFSVGLEGAQDYDLVLRLTEKAKFIKHIPNVLYHWRIHEQSTAGNSSAKDYAFQAQRTVLQNAFNRRGIDAQVEQDQVWPGVFHPRYTLKSEPKVSVIIPARNKADITELCLKTLFEGTSYSNFDVLVLSNNSDEADFFELLDSYKERYPNRFNWVEQNYPFNYSKLVNEGFKLVNGELILHLNNDIEIIHPDWMERMVEQAIRPEIGAVGAMLYYPNQLIQHAGVIIGLGGPAGHAFVGIPEERGGPYYQLVANNNYSAVTGACLMIHRDKYIEVGGFEEEQVVEFNDIDFCLKLLEKGYRNLYLSKVKLIHHESISRGHPHRDKKTYAQHLKDVGRFNKLWDKYIKNDPYYNPNLTRSYVDYRPRE